MMRNSFIRLTVTLTMLFLLVVFLSSTSVVVAHKLDIQVPDGKGSKKTVMIRHWHVCLNYIVKVPINDQEDRLEPRHKKELDPRLIEAYKKKLDAWIKKFHPKVIRRSPPTNEKNCHGVVFDGKNKTWIPEPSEYLKNCKVIDRKDAKVGDVVIYKYKGIITHSGKIIKIENGMIWVHSQWGNTGDFDHKIDEVVQGEEVEFEYPPGTKRKGDFVKYGTPTIYRCP